VNAAERIVRLAARGDGVTENGRFVPMTAPGDRVAADGSVEPGAHHIVPPCRHFPECGGCQLQHVDDAAYRRFIVDRIASALAAQAMPEPEFRPAHLSPPRTRRRASLRAERRGGQLLLGFNAEASHRIVDMRECHILRPELFNLVAPLRGLLGRLLPPRGRAEVRLTWCDQGADLLLQGVAPEGLEAAEAVTTFAAAHRLARFAVDDGYGAQTLWEPEPASVTLSGTHVPLPHGAFLQATAEGEAALVAAVRDAVGPAKTVADLFAGLGTFALALSSPAFAGQGDRAKRGGGGTPGRVLAVEAARDAALALKAAVQRAGRQVFVDHRDLYRRPLDAKELSRFDAVVLDPPRAGAREQVALLAPSPVPTLAYVSCNPNTFARDAATLIAGGYRLEWIRPVGQFRWSTHVELVGAFAR
jgi:23S rRNA (uracil1939-C5)-methyltransferase